MKWSLRAKWHLTSWNYQNYNSATKFTLLPPFHEQQNRRVDINCLKACQTEISIKCLMLIVNLNVKHFVCLKLKDIGVFDPFALKIKVFSYFIKTAAPRQHSVKVYILIVWPIFSLNNGNKPLISKFIKLDLKNYDLVRLYCLALTMFILLNFPWTLCMIFDTWFPLWLRKCAYTSLFILYGTLIGISLKYLFIIVPKRNLKIVSLCQQCKTTEIRYNTALFQYQFNTWMFQLLSLCISFWRIFSMNQVYEKPQWPSF